MATAPDSVDSSVCSICYGSFENPRKLPGCLHTFCENCLLTYIGNLKTDDKDLIDFQCPNCRSQICLPEGIEDFHIWIKSLKGLDTVEMASEKDTIEIGSLCVSCSDLGSSIPAEKYCVDCDENLCATCLKISHRSWPVCGHKIIDVQTIQEQRKDRKTLTYALSKYMRCKKHPDKTISVTCQDDNSLCCTDCIIENHRHCETIIKLQNGDFKPEHEASITKTKEKIEKMVSKIKSLVEFKNRNVEDIKQKAELIRDSVKEIRNKINTLFDALEENISSKVKAIIKKHVIEAGEEISKLNEMSKTLKDHLSIIGYSKQMGSNSHTYVIMSKISSKLEEEGNLVSKMLKSCDRIDINLKVKPVLQTLSETNVNGVDQLAEVTEEFQKTVIPGIDEKEQHIFMGAEKVAERTILPVSPPSPGPEYYGITYLSNSKTVHHMFFASVYYDFCFPVDNQYNAVGCISGNDLKGKPYSVTELKSGVVAVSLPDQKRILYFSENDDKTQFEMIGHVDTNFKPKALCGLSNGEMAVSWNDPIGFSVLHFKCCLYRNNFTERIYFVKDTAGRSLKSFDHMAVDEMRSHVIQPCTADKAVYCFDFEGNPKFKYSHDDLVYPRGVSISKDGNIFVCDEQNHVIHVISPDGVGMHVMRNNVPEKPLGIAFDRSWLEFAVTQNKNPWSKVVFYRLL